MRYPIPSPFKEIILFLASYVFAAGLTVFVHQLLLPFDVPWEVAWMYWMIVFAPVPVAAVLAAVFTAPPTHHLYQLYALCLCVTLVTMEGTILADPSSFLVVASVVATVSLGAAVMFRLAARE
jgi:hypothetical protein